MARKYGHKIKINPDPLAYNIGIIGESGIGKSTLAKEMCEKLVGEDGYIALNIGREDAHDAINGIVSENIYTWQDFEDFCDDVIENRFTDYKDLKIVILDTVDELMNLAEKETIRLHNKKNVADPSKLVDSINSAFGGYGRGMDTALELALNKLWDLKQVGVQFILIGHTKLREQVDEITGIAYYTLTTDMPQKYFNAFKNKLHFLGVAYINRKVIKQKTEQKNIGTGKMVELGRVQGETREISFRDDNYALDSKSRFAEIESPVVLDSNEVIRVIKEAISKQAAKGEHRGSKSNQPTKTEAQQAQKVLLRNKIDEELNVELLDYIAENFTKCTDTIKSKIKGTLKEYGIANFKSPNVSTQALQKIVNIIKKSISPDENE